MKKKEKTPYKIPTITKTQQKKRLMGDILLITLPCVALLLLLRVFFMIGAVPSRSMYPLMDTGYSMIANRMAYKFDEPDRGDVIVFKKGNSFLTKRIIGIPGDTVAIQNGIIYINEQPIVESYLAEENSTEPLNGINYYVVPEDSYFVLGDNRRDSNDSRAWKEPFIPVVNIKAKVICTFCLNPFSKGIAYHDVEDISMMETHSGVPMYDKDNIVVETTESLEKGDISGKGESINSTLPVVTIAPESIEETTPGTEDTNEQEGVSSEESGSTENTETTESSTAAESNEGMIDSGNLTEE